MQTETKTLFSCLKQNKAESIYKCRINKQRKLIITWKASHKHSNKDGNHLMVTHMYGKLAQDIYII